jgi:hypothetical protein
MLLAQQCIDKLRRVLMTARKVHSGRDHARMFGTDSARTPATRAGDSRIPDQRDRTTVSELKQPLKQQRLRRRNYWGVSFNSLLVNGVWDDTAAVPLSVNT